MRVHITLKEYYSAGDRGLGSDCLSYRLAGVGWHPPTPHQKIMREEGGGER